MAAEITIDAKGRAPGRVASEAAVALRGKNRPDFVRHLAPGVKLQIVNAAQMKLPLEKQTATLKSRYSGYPGGLKRVSWRQLIAKKGYAEPLRLAILGMLPKNKLRAQLIKQVTISE